MRAANFRFHFLGSRRRAFEEGGSFIGDIPLCALAQAKGKPWKTEGHSGVQILTIPSTKP
jgi:hypothetical protein